MTVIVVTLAAAGVEERVVFTQTWFEAHGSSTAKFSKTGPFEVVLTEGSTERQPLNASKQVREMANSASGREKLT